MSINIGVCEDTLLQILRSGNLTCRYNTGKSPGDKWKNRNRCMIFWDLPGATLDIQIMGEYQCLLPMLARCFLIMIFV